MDASMKFSFYIFFLSFVFTIFCSFINVSSDSDLVGNASDQAGSIVKSGSESAENVIQESASAVNDAKNHAENAAQASTDTIDNTKNTAENAVNGVKNITNEVNDNGALRTSMKRDVYLPCLLIYVYLIFGI
ncbi:hypothetical protein MANES_01G087650v8 [Manihot esculenta]|uniref:Uncharacterized protein n=1 Tax=Manihot esculenta TaxID=3983 RepID=A0ACB7IBT6_MANES|nr:hypothetical protein MANES_01G087650v8 [Manihot esculenta]